MSREDHRPERTPRPPSLSGRFIEEPNVQFALKRLSINLSDFTHEAGEIFGDASQHQSILWLPDRSKVTPFNLPTHITGPLVGAVASADLRTEADDPALFTTHEALNHTSIPLRGTQLRNQFIDSRESGGIPRPVISSMDKEQFLLGLPIRHEKAVLGMVQLALDRNIQGHATNLQVGKTHRLWRSAYEPVLSNALGSLKEAHQLYDSRNMLLDDLELDSPRIAANSIALSLDLKNSTERAIQPHNGAFNAFLLRWKQEVHALLSYHGVEQSHVIGNMGDGLSVVLWLPESQNFHKPDDVAAFRDLVAVPFAHDLQRMSRELADQYSELGPLTFRSQLGQAFIRTDKPEDMWSTDLWRNFKDAKEK